MIRLPVRSSNIQGIGHDPERNILEVQFKGGKVWRYQDVNPDEHAKLIRAESIGSHFAKFIKPYKTGQEVIT